MGSSLKVTGFGRDGDGDGILTALLGMLGCNTFGIWALLSSTVSSLGSTEGFGFDLEFINSCRLIASFEHFSLLSRNHNRCTTSNIIFSDEK